MVVSGRFWRYDYNPIQLLRPSALCKPVWPIFNSPVANLPSGSSYIILRSRGISTASMRGLGAPSEGDIMPKELDRPITGKRGEEKLGVIVDSIGAY
ncbi:shk1 kinase-binding protein 1 [Moniliophthora roreri]|nr:shk1 kinase-binding protein 1 [Moniliophthora roreri]